jgi:hypothetical protein
VRALLLGLSVAAIICAATGGRRTSRRRGLLE